MEDLTKKQKEFIKKYGEVVFDNAQSVIDQYYK